MCFDVIRFVLGFKEKNMTAPDAHTGKKCLAVVLSIIIMFIDTYIYIYIHTQDGPTLMCASKSAEANPLYASVLHKRICMKFRKPSPEDH